MREFFSSLTDDLFAKNPELPYSSKKFGCTHEGGILLFKDLGFGLMSITFTRGSVEHTIKVRRIRGYIDIPAEAQSWVHFDSVVKVTKMVEITEMNAQYNRERAWKHFNEKAIGQQRDLLSYIEHKR